MTTITASEFLSQLIIKVWSQPTGQIFLLSAVYYLFSAFILSGYMAYFAGGFGNIGFGDYSIIDFLFFLPTVMVTGLNMVVVNFWRVLGTFLLYLVGPNFLGFTIAYFFSRNPSWTNHIPNYIFAPTVYISFIIWVFGISIFLSENRYKNWIAFLLQLLGSFFFSMAAVGIALKGIVLPFSNISPDIANFILFTGDLIFLITRIGGLLLIILLAGMALAREAINYKYLSQIIRIKMAQAVPGLEKWRLQTEDNSKKQMLQLFKPKAIVSSQNEYAIKGDAFLVASLKRVTAVYVNESDNAFPEHGRLFLISNTDIQSIELKSGKKSI